jgi:prepilin-type N-terminal cleavage/methylation domain-containing protein
MENKATQSFTLIELLVVITVIGILALIAYPAYTTVQERAKATKDMNNLRQIGLATQMYMNDNDGTLFSPPATASWISQLYPKYLSAWNIFISPFDSPVNNPVTPNRTTSDNNANSAVSYGVNANIYPNNTAMAANKITKPTVFILFAPAQDSSNVVEFQGIANTTSSANLASSPNVTVLGIGSGKATSTPGGTNSGTKPQGTHSSRTKINALFADLHCENMSWTTFANNTALTADPDAGLRWTPYIPYP